MYFQSCIQCHQVFSRATRIHNCVAAATAVRPNCFRPKYSAVQECLHQNIQQCTKYSAVQNCLHHSCQLFWGKNLRSCTELLCSCNGIWPPEAELVRVVFSYTRPLLLLLSPCLWLHSDEPATLDLLKPCQQYGHSLTRVNPFLKLVNLVNIVNLIQWN